MIEISRIKTDGGTQPRVSTHQETVAEYREAYKAGIKMPPVTLFYDGTDYWLADGFHRFWAAKEAGLTEIYEEIQPGTLRDAILFSLSANAKHGLRRTNADKRKAIQTLLDDPEWRGWSNEKIAEVCAVSPHTVADAKKSHSANAELAGNSHSANAELGPVIYTTKHGTTATMHTANIGKQKPAEPEPTTAPEEPPEPEYTPLDEAMDTIKDLQDALALANAGDISEADRSQAADLIARLREENRVLTLKLAAMTASRDGFMQQVAELKKQCAMQRKELAKR